MIDKPLVAALLASAILSGCTEGEARPAANDVPRAGKWEVTTVLIDIAGPKLTPDDLNKMRKLFSAPRVEHQCFPGVAPKVGSTLLEGRCTYTRVGDKGAVVDRVAKCRVTPALDSQITTKGSRSVESYAYDIVTTARELPSGRATASNKVRETGRYLGPC